MLITVKYFIRLEPAIIDPISEQTLIIGAGRSLVHNDL